MLAKLSFKFKLLILSFICSAQAIAADVLFIAPKDSVYWTSVYTPMKSVAKQLGINLSILRPPMTAAFDFEPELKSYLKNHKKPDWVIWAPRSNSPIKMLTLLEELKIYSINISNPIVENQQIGQPMDIYKYWKAEISSSNYIGTYKMMSELVKQAHQYNSRPPYSLIAITGKQHLKSAQKVTTSIHAVSEEIRNLRLLQIVHTDWSRRTSSAITEKLLKRHHYGQNRKGAMSKDKVDLIWSGNIDIALGTVDAVEKFTSTYKNAQRPLIASQGWHPDIFTHIKNKKIKLSVGGNHLNGIWALVLIYDHINGIELTQDSYDKVQVLDKYIVSSNNVNEISQIFNENYWDSIDIKRYSKTDNKWNKLYDFNIERLLYKN